MSEKDISDIAGSLDDTKREVAMGWAAALYLHPIGVSEPQFFHIVIRTLPSSLFSSCTSLPPPPPVKILVGGGS